MKLAKQIFFAIGAGSFFACPNSPERGNSPRAKQAAGAVAAAFSPALFSYIIGSSAFTNVFKTASISPAARRKR
jgi:hypothetical protein